MRLDLQQTIVAIASPPAPAERGIVRLSGRDAIPIALAGARLPLEAAPSHPASFQVDYKVSTLAHPVPALLLVWPGPRSYTAEPCVEIHTIGCAPILEQVLGDCLSRGARLAQPGEFTLRAFLNGRLDLSQAEAVHDVVAADNREQLDLALRQLSGGLRDRIALLRSRILDLLAHIEAGLDFVDEADVDPIARSQQAAEIATLRDQVAALGSHQTDRAHASDHPRVVLVGPPNAGKSSLFNALADTDLAIVSPRAGTTRDYLSALIAVGRHTIELIDTAGADDSDAPLDQAARSLAERNAATARLLLSCRGPDQTFLDPRIEGPAVLRVLTKQDLARQTPDDASIPVSVWTGSGLAELRSEIERRLDDLASDSSTPTLSARCADSLRAAADALDRAKVLLLDSRASDELVAVELRQCLDDLGQITGTFTADDILDRIFSRFCIGK